MLKVIIISLIFIAFFTSCSDKKDAVYGPGNSDTRVRFYNGLVYTGDAIIEAELWVEGNRITYIGEPKPSAHKFDLEYDLKENLLMPGFKNAHAHSPMTFLRSFADDLPLDRWLNEMVFPMEAKLEAEDVYWLYTLAVLEYIEGGITAAFDMYFFTEEMARAANDTGFRAVFCSPVNDFSESIEIHENNFLHFNNYNERITYHIGFHAEYTTSEELLKQVAELSHKYKSPVFFHNSETAAEVEGCIERHGMTPTAYLNSLGLFEFGGGSFHCVHITGEDIAIMREKNMAVITNPASNCKLASGIAPVREMLDAGLLVGIGTDGAASNNALDMFREMYLAASLQRILLNDAAAVGADEILEMAVRSSALIMGLDEAVSLETGMLADLFVLDLNQPNMQPKNDIVKNIVYAGGKQNVILTMVNGRILYENGEYYIGIPADEIYAKAEAIINRIK